MNNTAINAPDGGALDPGAPRGEHEVSGQGAGPPDGSQLLAVSRSKGSGELHRPHFEPDAMLPVQWHQNAGASSLAPERRLLLAILEEAVLTFQRYALDRRRRGSRLFREAEEWVLSDDVGWPGSFRNICDGLGLDAAYLRRGLMQWRDHRRANPAAHLWRSPFRRLCGSRTRAVGRPIGSGRRQRLDATC